MRRQSSARARAPHTLYGYTLPSLETLVFAELPLAIMLAALAICWLETILAFVAPHRVTPAKVNQRWNNLLLNLGLTVLAAAFAWQRVGGGDLSGVLLNTATLLVAGNLVAGWITRRRGIRPRSTDPRG